MKPLSETTIEALGNGELVLLCGDDDAATLTTASLLERAGFRVARTLAVELYEAVRVKRPSVVVLRLEGDRRRLLLADILRGDPLGRRTSIVVTCASLEATYVDAIRAGANAVFQEPLHAGAFLSRVARLAGVPRRIAFDVPVVLRKLGGGGVSGAVSEGSAPVPIRARTVDASETGLLLDAAAPLDLDASYLVEARVPRGDFVLRARVVRRAGERGPTHFGVAFQHDPDLMRRAVLEIGSCLRAA